MIGFSFTQNNTEYVIVLPSITYTSRNKVYVGSQELEILDNTVMASLEAAIVAYRPGGSSGNYEQGYADGEAAMESTIASSQAVTANLYKSKLASEDADIAAADATDIDGQGTIFSESYQYLKTTAEMQANYNSGYNSGYSSGETDGETTGYANGQSAAASAQATVAGQYKSKLSSEDADIAAADATTLAGQGTIFSESYQYLKTSAEMQANYNSGYTAGETVGETTGYANGQSAAASAQATVAGQYKSKLSSEDATIAAADATTLAGQGTIFTEGYQYLKTGAEMLANYNSGYNSGYTAGEAAAAGTLFTKNDFVQPLNFSLYGNDVWSDGVNTYYSGGTALTQYVLDVAKSAWTRKTWTGLSAFRGRLIWSDGVNIYNSSSANQYVLNVATSTWTAKTWTGLTNFSGACVWTDGVNIYYSERTDHYVLDVSTSTWTAKTWTGLTNFYGYDVWSDGVNIYYSDGDAHYILDVATSTWSRVAWQGFIGFYGSYIWKDGTNIYYSEDGIQKVLDAETPIWNPKTWNGLTYYQGPLVWSDGVNIYYSDGSEQYVLDRATSTWNPKTWYTSFLIPNDAKLLSNGTAYEFSDIDMSFKPISNNP